MALLDRVMGRNPAHVSHKLKGAKRLEGESYEKYKQRLRYEKDLLASYLRGDLIWCSVGYKRQQFGESEDGSPFYIMVKDKQVSKGTYVKKKHGTLETPRETI